MDKLQAFAGQIIMRCFDLRTIAHVAHLQTESYAQHVALKELYDGIIPLVDSFAEVYQGMRGVITEYPLPNTKMYDKRVLVLMNDTSTWINEQCALLDEDDKDGMGALKNIVDEIQALFYSTRYKLRFLA